MAGNQSDARQSAYNAWKDAVGTDPKGADTKTLKTALDAAAARENAALGTPGQRRY